TIVIIIIGVVGFIVYKKYPAHKITFEKQEGPTSIKSKYVKCPYCEVEYESSRVKCPNCGAPNKHRKKR
ncbi:MAG: hypothetical protein ACTSQY_06095, partial [Candidatus Odinarchaeia archaeon]